MTLLAPSAPTRKSEVKSPSTSSIATCRLRTLYFDARAWSPRARVNRAQAHHPAQLLARIDGEIVSGRDRQFAVSAVNQAQAEDICFGVAPSRRNSNSRSARCDSAAAGFSHASRASKSRNFNPVFTELMSEGALRQARSTIAIRILKISLRQAMNSRERISPQMNTKSRIASSKKSKRFVFIRGLKFLFLYGRRRYSQQARKNSLLDTFRRGA